MARSPARVAWFTVMDGAFAPIAMAATDAIVFITVLGKIIGERPAGPRRRNPCAKSRLEVKSPYSVPTTMPSPGPPATSASRTARRHAPRARRQMRDSRRAASRSTSDANVASSTSAASRLDSALVSNARTGPIAERPRASAPASASRPPAVDALTVPIPVTTTRRSVRASGFWKMRLTFWPPNPKEFDSAAPTSAGRATPGRQSKGTSASTCSRFAVGGNSPCWSARIVAAASTLPAAAMVWPTSDLVELTSTPPSPKT